MSADPDEPQDEQTGEWKPTKAERDELASQPIGEVVVLTQPDGTKHAILP